MPRNPIQQLSPALVNRIAAGEVIERPASVVKELVENAIDAGATHITVEIEDGGRALIRIIDDGSGMPVEELPLAFASHATSKLQSDEDLFRISTMGFRGEALASIGAVSHARILSRTPAQEVAYEIFNRGGVIDQPQAAAGNVGTVVEIRNLFFNTPARRKFLKGAATEFGHISEALVRLAVPHPEISFVLSHNGKPTFELAAETAKRRWLCAWPDDFAESGLPVERQDAEIGLVGLIGLPELARPVAKHQFFFLNGRPIRDRFIQHALREAYRGLTEPGRQPAAILLITMPPQDVDVNVHPTKSEVRFRDSARIHGLILSSIREKLLGSDLTPLAVPRPTLRSSRTRRNTRSCENGWRISSNRRCRNRAQNRKWPPNPPRRRLGAGCSSPAAHRNRIPPTAGDPASQQLSRRRKRRRPDHHRPARPARADHVRRPPPRAFPAARWKASGC